MNNDQLTRARAFAKQYLEDHPTERNDTWSDFEEFDLHMYFDEPEFPDDCGVYAYPTYTDDDDGFTHTDCDHGIKILTHDLQNAYHKF